MPAETAPRLHRSATDRAVAGVCGGLAEYLEVEPTLVRLAFIVGTLWGGLGVLVYVILAIVPAGRSAGATDDRSSPRAQPESGWRCPYLPRGGSPRGQPGLGTLVDLGPLLASGPRVRWRSTAASESRGAFGDGVRSADVSTVLEPPPDVP
jgi:phage shock protein C